MSKKRTRRKRRNFSDEYKAEVVELCRTSGKSIGVIAQELDLTETAVREWVKRAGPEEPEPASDDLDLQAELRAAKKRIRELEMEREIPKKAKSRSLLREGELVSTFEFIDVEKADFPIAMLCRVLGVSRR